MILERVSTVSDTFWYIMEEESFVDIHIRGKIKTKDFNFPEKYWERM